MIGGNLSLDRGGLSAFPRGATLWSRQLLRVSPAVCLRARRQATSPCMPSMRVKSCRSIPRHSMRSSSRYRGLSSYSAHGPLKLTTLSVVQSTFGAMAASAARAVLGRVLLHQSDEALAHLRGVLAWSCHGSILSTRMGPPTIPARFRTGFPNQDADAIFAEHNCTIQLTAVACGGTFTSSQWSPTCL
jgi:hypothetical protein